MMSGFVEKTFIIHRDAHKWREPYRAGDSQRRMAYQVASPPPTGDAYTRQSNPVSISEPLYAYICQQRENEQVMAKTHNAE